MTIASQSGSGFAAAWRRDVGTTSVVLCDSNAEVAQPLLAAVENHGLHTTWCRDGATALLEVGATAPTVLVIADQIDGALNTAEVVAAVRDHTDVPVLVGADPEDHTTARRALSLGGSAVIARPYDPSAVIAFAGAGEAQSEPYELTAGPLIVNTLNYEVRLRGNDVVLTRRELDVLVYLIRQRGRVASSEQISAAVWGHRTNTNTVAVHVKRLRAKLGSDVEHGKLIRTIRGAGYRLAPSICD
ncbi:response regulator transcription factor [Mycobacterium hubeiense]|uniref:response regulator transcription factor n=1 Tax=Mycobacterium hubeiense TaxID=1867256 RepID=UPI0013046CCE|nr:response regulator transcription factor [Mycobacterium sp. QGD 101]